MTKLTQHADCIQYMVAMRHADIDQREHQDRGGDEFQYLVTVSQSG